MPVLWHESFIMKSIRPYSNFQKEIGSFDTVDSEAHLYNLTNDHFKPEESYLKNHILTDFFDSQHEEVGHLRHRRSKILEYLIVIMITVIFVCLLLLCYEKFYAEGQRRLIYKNAIARYMSNGTMEFSNQLPKMVNDTPLQPTYYFV